MTYSKQITILKELIEKLGKDFVIFNILDTWSFEYKGEMGIERVETVRETITLGDVYEQFLNKTGIYVFLKVTEDFRNLMSNITKSKFNPYTKKAFYQDSYDRFMEEWAKLHPDKSYEDWENEQRRKRKAFINHLTNTYISYAYDSEPFYLFGCKSL